MFPGQNSHTSGTVWLEPLEQAMGTHFLDVSYQGVERNCPPHGFHWVRERVLRTAQDLPIQ